MPSISFEIDRMCELTFIYVLLFAISCLFRLVNNVGRMYDYPEELGKLAPDFLWNLVNINVSSVTMMTRMLVNDMKKRGRGAIVNVSSGSELQPLPYAAVYGACKVSSIRACNFFHNLLMTSSF